jgi:hypothetical protein
MAQYCVLAMPGAAPGGSGPLFNVPTTVHLKGGGVARPSAQGFVLVESDDARDLLANGWTVVCGGDSSFLSSILSMTNAAGQALWIAGPKNSFDASNTWLPST